MTTPDDLPPLPAPWDYAYVWNGWNGQHRNFSPASRNGSYSDETVLLFTAAQMRDYARQARAAAPAAPAPMSGQWHSEGVSAMETLKRLGYTYHCGELWKPPLGAAPAQPAEPVAYGTCANLEMARHAADQARRDGLVGMYPASCVVLDMALSNCLHAAPPPPQPLTERAYAVIQDGLIARIQALTDQNAALRAKQSPLTDEQRAALRIMLAHYANDPRVESLGALLDADRRAVLAAQQEQPHG